MKSEFVRVSKSFDQNLKDLETSLRVRALVIKNAKPIDNFKMELTRKVFSAYVKFLYLYDNNTLDEVSIKRIFSAVMLKTIDPLIKKYSFKNGPAYYFLFNPDQIDEARNKIKEAADSMSSKDIMDMRQSVKNQLNFVDIIMEYINKNI